MGAGSSKCPWAGALHPGESWIFHRVRWGEVGRGTKRLPAAPLIASSGRNVVHKDGGKTKGYYLGTGKQI